MLTAAPTGVAWNTIPVRNALPAQQVAEQLNLCQRATAMIDAYCNSTLRCTLNTEIRYGPDWFVTMRKNGATRVMLSRPPVTQVTAAQVSPASAFPPQWTTIPSNQFSIERPLLGIYGTSSPSDSGDGGQTVLLAPGYVNWGLGRNGYQLSITYLNGWPHTGVTAPGATAGANTIPVDDCTGWAPAGPGLPGATGVVFDGSSQEAITCTAASATTGPGTLTLSANLGYSHSAGVIVSAMPQQVQWAAILFAASQALTRGGTATTIQQLGGHAQGSRAPEDLAAEAELIIHPFRRVL